MTVPESVIAAEDASALENSAEQLSLKSPMTGWLTKIGGHGISRNWRKRYFVLHAEEASLYYFKSPEDQVPAGVIYLPDFTHIEVDETCKKSKYCWKLSAKMTDAISAPVCVVGVEAIVLDKKSGGPSMNLSSADQQPSSIDDDAKDIAGDKGAFPSRIYFAYADSLNECQDWINAIKPFLGSSIRERQVKVKSQLFESLVADIPASVSLQVPEEVSFNVPPTPLDMVDYLMPPPTPPVDAPSPLRSATHSSLVVDATQEIVGGQHAAAVLIAHSESKEANEEGPITSPSVGYKVSSLYTKMADLDLQMKDLESKSKEDLKVLHDTFRMAYAMLQREVVRVKDNTQQPPQSQEVKN